MLNLNNAKKRKMEKDVVKAFFNDSFTYMNISDIIDEKELIQIFKNAVSYLKKNFKSFVVYDHTKFKRVVYLGDLHGSLESFEFICEKFYDKETLFVILGDVIDRREKTLELFVIILSLMIKNKNILYIRGNHETKDMQLNSSNLSRTLKHFILKQYYIEDEKEWYGNIEKYENKELVRLMIDIFKELPLVAYCKGILNFHGGFINKKKFSFLEDFKKLEKKCEYEINSPEFQILWNDPVPKTKRCLFNSNYLRGHNSYVFGPRATNKFFNRNKQVKLVITGHTHKQPPKFDFDINGYCFCHNNKILTLLSCFNTQKSTNEFDQNKGGIAVLENNEIKIYTFYLKVYKEYNKYGKIDEEYGKFENNEEWKLEEVSTKIKIV